MSSEAMYFVNSVRTACHYECVEWAEDTAVNKLLNLGMELWLGGPVSDPTEVIGGGMAIVTISNSIGTGTRAIGDRRDEVPKMANAR